jgi:hypothetical protein
MIHDFERIQQSYEKQCEDIMNYVEMIDNLRTVVYKNIRELSGTPTFQTATDPIQPQFTTTVRHEKIQQSEATGNNHPQSDGDDNNEEHPNKIFIKKIRGTTKKTIEQAEDGLNKLDGVIKQLRTNMQKK